jgi:uncharacterized protein
MAMPTAHNPPTTRTHYNFKCPRGQPFGILVMNIQSYSMVDAAYMNPTYGDLTGLNRWVDLSHLLAQLKFVTIFSSIWSKVLLFTGRAEAKGYSPRGLHYRGRLVVTDRFVACLPVMVRGHPGNHALCSMVVVLCRKWSPKLLVVIGGLSFAFASFLYLISGFPPVCLPRPTRK